MASVPGSYEDLYGGGGMSEEAAQESMSEGGETAVLPISILAGKEFNPGDSVILKVVRIGDGEVEVAYDYEAGEGEMVAEEEAPMVVPGYREAPIGDLYS